MTAFEGHEPAKPTAPRRPAVEPLLLDVAVEVLTRHRIVGFVQNQPGPFDPAAEDVVVCSCGEKVRAVTGLQRAHARHVAAELAFAGALR